LLEEKSQVKLIRRHLPLVLAGAFCIPFASAQSTFDVNVGLGAVSDSAASGIDYTTNLLCASGSSTTCIPSKSLSGFMLGIGGNLMLWKHFGVGAEVDLQPAKQTYYTCPAACVAQIGQGISSFTEQSRTTFYDFNGIFVPVRSKKAQLQLSGGIGGANFKTYQNFTAAATAITSSQSSSQYAGSLNKFQVHGGVGVQIYLTDHFYIRPQFDIHYVKDFTPYGRNTPFVGQVWVGYSFGGQ
jgi:hypothetical protein